MKIAVKKYDNEGNELAIRFGIGAIKAVGVNMIEEMVKNRQKNGGQFKDISDFAVNAGAKTINKKALEALARAGAFDSIHSNRNQIIESVETICKFATAKQEERNSNQMSLFGLTQTNQEKLILKASNQWTDQEKLQEEFKAFGFFLNEHPIDSHLESLAKRGVISSQFLEDIEDDHIIKLAGVMANSKHKSGPKGRYAYLTLSDPFGIYEASIFDEALITKHRDQLVDGKSLVLECLVKKNQGGSRILVKSIESLEQFISQNQPKKEPYQDIKIAKKTEFNWKKRNQDFKQNSRQDILVKEAEIQRKNDQLKNQTIIKEIYITINNSSDILKLKGFLSQKLIPKDSKKFSKVFFTIKNSNDDKNIEIELDDKYAISEEDSRKIAKFTNIILT